jgi:hypothetical protein
VRTVLAAYAFIFSGNVLATTLESCAEILDSSKGAARIAERLAPLSHLAPLMARVWTDPAIPSHFKRILKSALLDQDVGILELSPELRERVGIDANAAYAYRPANYVLVRPVVMARLRPGLIRRWLRRVRSAWAGARQTEATTSNAECTRRADRAMLERLAPAIFVQNRPLDADHNDLIALIHELAHFRFFAFIEAHLEPLLRVLPPHILNRFADGTIGINQDFFDFTSELYSWQTEYAFMRATLGPYFTEVYPRYRDLMTTPNEDRHHEESIARHVLDTYGIVDPDVRALAEFPLADILRGIPFRR